MIVVDASVALKWVFDEEFSYRAVELLDATDVPIAPTLLLIEAGNALWKRVRRNEVSAVEARELLHTLERQGVGWVDEHALVEPALALASSLNHPIYDCVYLALALREDVKLATADLKFARVLHHHGYGDRLHLIGDMPA